MNGLAEFIHMFMDHPSDEQHTHMKESLIAMTDLTDDERSPRFQFSEQQVMDDVGQAFQGYQAGMSDESENATETEEQRYHRYCQSTLSEVSDPDTWMEVHHEAEDERYHRYMVSERHEVSAVELWDEQQDQMVRENDEIARGELVDENELWEMRSRNRLTRSCWTGLAKVSCNAWQELTRSLESSESAVSTDRFQWWQAVALP